MTDRQPVLNRLAEAGFAVEAFTAEQREVLRTLTPQELALLVDLKARLDEAGPEVQAHSEIAGGALF
jgi:hypothetical protein